MIGTRKKIWPRSSEANRLRLEIERSKEAIQAAQNHFEQVVDPTLIDCYIYELNAAQLRLSLIHILRLYLSLPVHHYHWHHHADTGK